MRAAVDVMGGDHAPGGHPQGLLGGRAAARRRRRRSSSSATRRSSATASPPAGSPPSRRSAYKIVRDDAGHRDGRLAGRGDPRQARQLDHRDVQAGRQGRGRCRRSPPATPARASPRRSCGCGRCPASAGRASRSSCRRFTGRSSSATSAPTSRPSPSTSQQYAIMAGAYATAVCGIENPRVGLLSIGEEDAKGTALVKEARKLMRDEPQINFIGNVEGRDLFKGVGRRRRVRRVRRQHHPEVHRRHRRRTVPDDPGRAAGVRAGPARAVQAGDEEDLRTSTTGRSTAARRCWASADTA